MENLNDKGAAAQDVELTDVTDEELEKSLDALEAFARELREDDDLNKSADGDDDEPGEDENDDEPGEDENDDEDMGKSFREELIDGSENIEKAVEVSDFLDDVVTGIGQAMDDLRITVMGRLDRMEKSLAGLGEEMVKSVRGSMARNGETAEAIEDLKKSLGEVLDSPARGRKAVRFFEKSFGGQEIPAGGEPMTKSQILSKMMGMVERGEPGVTSSDVLRFESGGQLSSAVQQALGLKG